MIEIKTVLSLPNKPEAHCMYRLFPNEDARGDAYRARTDRNDGCLVGVIEQPILKNASIAVIGLGGMGGYQAETYVRLGIGDMHIADIGTFDASNINRQWGATRETTNVDKAFATARLMRAIADDYTLTVCPLGLNERTADMLIKDRTVVIDMIEFWNVADRILLHRTCAKHKVNAINCNSIVHGSFGMRFDYATEVPAELLGGYATLIERYLGMTYERARYLQTQYELGQSTRAEKSELMEAVFSIFVPREQEYLVHGSYSTRRAFRSRLLEEGRVPVISVNPPFAAGICATEAYFEILEQRSPIKRDITRIATFPEVTHIDLGKKTVTTLKLSVRPPLKHTYA